MKTPEKRAEELLTLFNNYYRTYSNFQILMKEALVQYRREILDEAAAAVLKADEHSTYEANAVLALKNRPGEL